MTRTDKYKDEQEDPIKEDKVDAQVITIIQEEKPPKQSAFLIENEQNVQNSSSSCSIVLIFIAFLAVFFLVPAIKSKSVDSNNHTLPFDQDLRACGGFGKNYSSIEYSYVYYPRPEQYMINTFNVCVKECPLANTTSIECQTNRSIQNCNFTSPYQIYDTRPAFGSACVPTDNSLFKTLEPAFGISSIESIVLYSKSAEFRNSILLFVGIAIILIVLLAILPCCRKGAIILGNVTPIVFATLLLLFVIAGLICVCVNDFKKFVDTNSIEQKIEKLTLNNRPAYFHLGLLFAAVLIFIRFVYQSCFEFDFFLKDNENIVRLQEVNDIIKKQKLLMYSLPPIIIAVCVLWFTCWAVQVFFMLPLDEESRQFFLLPFEKRYSTFFGGILSTIEILLGLFFLQVIKSFIEFRAILLTWEYKVKEYSMTDKTGFFEKYYLKKSLSFTESFNIILEDAFRKFFRFMLDLSQQLSYLMFSQGEDEHEEYDENNDQFEQLQDNQLQHADDDDDGNHIIDTTPKDESERKEQQQQLKQEQQLHQQKLKLQPEEQLHNLDLQEQNSENKQQQQQQQLNGLVCERKEIQEGRNRENINATFQSGNQKDINVEMELMEMNRNSQQKENETPQQGNPEQEGSSPTNNELKKEEEEIQDEPYFYPTYYFLSISVMHALKQNFKKPGLNNSELFQLEILEFNYEQLKFNELNDFLLDSICYCISFLSVVLTSVIHLNQSSISDESVGMFEINSLIQKIPLALIIGIISFNLTSIAFSVYHSTIKYSYFFTEFIDILTSPQIETPNPIQIDTHAKPVERQLLRQQTSASASTGEIVSSNREVYEIASNNNNNINEDDGEQIDDEGNVDDYNEQATTNQLRQNIQANQTPFRNNLSNQPKKELTAEEKKKLQKSLQKKEKAEYQIQQNLKKTNLSSTLTKKESFQDMSSVQTTTNQLIPEKKPSESPFSSNFSGHQQELTAEEKKKLNNQIKKEEKAQYEANLNLKNSKTSSIQTRKGSLNEHLVNPQQSGQPTKQGNQTQGGNL